MLQTVNGLLRNHALEDQTPTDVTCFHMHLDKGESSFKTHARIEFDDSSGLLTILLRSTYQFEHID